MRRTMAMLALLTGVGVAATMTVSAAGASRFGGFCDNYVEDIEEGVDDARDLPLEELAPAVIDLYERYEERGPRPLRRSFKILRQYYDDAVEQIETGEIDTEQLERAGRALEKINTYLVNKCGLDPEDLGGIDPSGGVPGTE